MAIASTKDGQALLETALAAHGGVERWRRVAEVVMHATGGGAAPLSKGKPHPLEDTELRFSTREQRTVLSPWPRPGQRGVFSGDRVHIESEAGERLAERENPRPHFRRPRRALWWDDLDFLYFVGYAMWGYASAPFVFVQPGFEVEEIEPWEQDGESLRRLAVTFPEDVAAHSREQVYFFDNSGLLRRNDYTAEVFGLPARGGSVHLCTEHRTFDGLVFSTRRRVYRRRRNGRPALRPTLVWIEIADVTLVDG